MVIPILGAFVSLLFVVSLDRNKALAGLIALAVGCVVYLVSRPQRARVGVEANG
jgi:hypothetical protein